jgi:hypothetical protein
MMGFTTAVNDLRATVGGLTSRIALAAIFGVSASLVIVVTLWFLGDALSTLLAEQGFRRSAAAGLTGGAGLLLAAILGLAAKLAMRPHAPTVPAAAAPAARVRPSTGNVVNDLALEIGAIAAEQMGSTVRSHPYGTMGASLAAGLALGAMPELRKALFDLAAKR